MYWGSIEPAIKFDFHLPDDYPKLQATLLKEGVVFPPDCEYIDMFSFVNKPELSINSRIRENIEQSPPSPVFSQYF